MIINIRKLKLLRRQHGQDKIVLTVGAYDILHPGHIEYLTFAKQQGDALVVAVPSDVSIRERKGDGRPVNDERTRCLILDALKPVDYVCVMDSPYIGLTVETSRLLRPDTIVVYQDWPETDVADLRSRFPGTRVCVYRNEKRYSTTDTLRRIVGEEVIGS